MYIYICHNALPINFTKEVREFILSIAVDLSKPYLNDTDNRPSREVFKEAEKYPDSTISSSNVDLNSNIHDDWTWVNYAS